MVTGKINQHCFLFQLNPYLTVYYLLNLMQHIYCTKYISVLHCECRTFTDTHMQQTHGLIIFMQTLGGCKTGHVAVDLRVPM